MLYPTQALAYGKIVSLDYAISVCKAYNDWLYETYVKFNPRFKGMALIPMQDPEEAAKELRRAVTELGMLGGDDALQRSCASTRFEDVLAGL